MSETKLKNEIIETIKTIHDPEIPVNIYDLGLIYGIDIDKENNVHITMTLTSPNCPVADIMPLEVEHKIGKIKEVNETSLEITFEPPWEIDMMTDAAKLELGYL